MRALAKDKRTGAAWHAHAQRAPCRRCSPLATKPLITRTRYKMQSKLWLFVLACVHEAEHTGRRVGERATNLAVVNTQPRRKLCAAAEAAETEAACSGVAVATVQKLSALHCCIPRRNQRVAETRNRVHYVNCCFMNAHHVVAAVMQRGF